MKDRTTPDPDRYRESNAPSPPSVGRLLETRPTDRYVPSTVRCANCGCDGGEFSWFQRIEAGAVADGEPATDLHFCDIVCLALYVGDTYPAYDPTPGPVGVRYDSGD